MTKEELSIYQSGENLDQLMNLDPRGYGICRILYAGSREYTGEPLSTHCAKELVNLIHPGDVVLIITGFILRPHKIPEMDGIVSSILLARALVEAFDAKPVIVCPDENIVAVRNCAPVIGMHLYQELDQLLELPLSMGVMTFTKEKKEAEQNANAILNQCNPKAVIAIEAPGANQLGEYHNAIGINCTELEAKSDILFEEARKRGIWNMAIGDLGNEIGMGTIAEHIRTYIPYAAEGECQCECKGGILARSSADHIITATVSDWGCYALIAAIAFLKRNMKVMHTPEMERTVMEMASKSGMIDMTGSLLPGIDGFDINMNATIVSLMRQCIEYALHYKNDRWFQTTLEKNFYQKHVENKKKN